MEAEKIFASLILYLGEHFKPRQQKQVSLMTIEMKAKEGEWDSERESGGEYKWREEGGEQREGKGEMNGEGRNGDGG